MNVNQTVGLGTLLRRLLDLTDGDLERIYAEEGLDYVPRYTPVMRAVAQSGPLTIQQISKAAGVSHSAASQTVSRMVSAGFVCLERGEDARERLVRLTEYGLSLLPRLRERWKSTEAAALSLEREIGWDLHAVLAQATAALEGRTFAARIRDEDAARRPRPAKAARTSN